MWKMRKCSCFGSGMLLLFLKEWLKMSSIIEESTAIFSYLWCIMDMFAYILDLPEGCGTVRSRLYSNKRNFNHLMLRVEFHKATRSETKKITLNKILFDSISHYWLICNKALLVMRKKRNMGKDESQGSVLFLLMSNPKTIMNVLICKAWII